MDKTVPPEVKAFVVGFESSVDHHLKKIYDLELLDYPTALSQNLLRVCREAIVDIRRQVQHLLTQEDLELSEFLRKSWLLAWLHEIIHLVELSSAGRNPRWLIASLKANISQRVEEAFDVLIVPGKEGGNFWFHNSAYDIVDVFESAFGKERADQILWSESEPDKSLPAHIAIFAYPLAEKDNALLHSIFYHEIGHLLDRDILGISDQVRIDLRGSEPGIELERKLETAANAIADKELGRTEGLQLDLIDEHKRRLLTKLLVNCANVIRAWGLEFAADLIATRILGPAYVLAVITNPVSLSLLDVHSDGHPSTRLRLRAIFGLLGNPEIGNFFSESKDTLERCGTLELLEEWRKRAVAIEPAQWDQESWLSDQKLSDPVLAFADALVKGLASRVVQKLGGEWYSPGKLVEDFEKAGLYKQLRNGFTINESLNDKPRKRKPCSVPTILNIGWAGFLHPDGITDPDYRSMIMRLVRKSIELSQVQRYVVSSAASGAKSGAPVSVEP